MQICQVRGVVNALEPVQHSILLDGGGMEGREEGFSYLVIVGGWEGLELRVERFGDHCGR